MAIARKARKAGLLYIAGQSVTPSGWAQPTGDYTFKLYDASGIELTGAGYLAGTKAVLNCWALYGSGAAWAVKNAVSIRVPNTGNATAAWEPFSTVKVFRVGETDADFEFPLASPVTIAEGTAWEAPPGTLILDDDSE